MTDSELLREYVQKRCDKAFAELVRRHIDWLSSAALRQTRNRQLADDVTQAACIALALKARSLCSDKPLEPWLFQVIRHAAANTMRSETRRKRHEQRAAAMTPESSPIMTETQWGQLAPVLDELVDKLTNQDRLAILLRFYQGKSFEDMGKAMGVSEEAARKRADRAVDKLRGMFAKRGFTAGAATLATALATNITRPAEAALATTTITTAMAATQATVVAGHALAIAKGALQTMAWAKAKLMIATGVALLFLGTGTTVMTRHLMAQRPVQPAASQPLAQGGPAALAEEIVDNPEYQSWSKCKAGTTVTLSIETTTRGTTTKEEITRTLVELTAEKAVVEGTLKHIEPSSQNIVKAKDAFPAKVKKADVVGPDVMPPSMKGQTMVLGDEDVTIGGKTYTCKVVQLTVTDTQSGLKTTAKSWTCQEVPGRSVKLEASYTGAVELVAKTTLTTVHMK